MAVRLGLLKDDEVKKLEQSENSIVRWMYNASGRDGPISEKMRIRLGGECVSEVMRAGKL